MDAFDKYIYDEITKTFAKSNISDEEYEELYQRFDNLSNEPEAKPYLFAMRYMGWGTKKQPESVIDELEELLTDCERSYRHNLKNQCIRLQYILHRF